MERPPPTSVEVYFGSLTDPRVERTKAHRLGDIITIALCAVLCGANDWVAVETFGRAKEAWLRTFLPLPGGIPAHDTFGRVFARLDPAELQRCFVAWVQAVLGELPPQVVAVDGKTLRRSADRSRGQAALHLVSAWATASGLVLGQEATDAKSNEITAVPRLLRLLALEGCVVTIDAMGCQRAIAAQVQEQGADYVLALKANQPTLHATVVAAFAEAHRQHVIIVGYSMTMPYLLALYQMHLQFGRTVDLDNLQAALMDIERQLGSLEDVLENRLQRAVTMLTNAYNEGKLVSARIRASTHRIQTSERLAEPDSSERGSQRSLLLLEDEPQPAATGS